MFAKLSIYILLLSCISYEVKSECGGILSGDVGTIIYPDPNTAKSIVQVDELCIWTIHLETKTSIKLNFSHLDFEGGDSQCSQGAVKTYSLTNTVTQGDMESYTICPGADSLKESRGIYYLSDNAMVVVFRTSPSGEQGGTGIVLSWEGVKFVSEAVKHEAHIISEPTGIIRYPIVGEYSSNSISTWLVQSSEVKDGFNVIVESGNIETCSSKRVKPLMLADTTNCFCDAFILYQVDASGSLREVKRFCGDIETAWNTTLTGAGFVAVLYSDSLDVQGDGTGIQMIWTPVEVKEELATTCSQVLNLEEESLRGRIKYMRNSESDESEVCMWTLRANGVRNLTININSFTASDCNSELVLHYTIFDRWGDRELFSEVLANCDSSISSLMIPGPLAFISLNSNSSSSFDVSITQSLEHELTYPTTSVYTDTIYTGDTATVRYENYKNEEFSSILIAPSKTIGLAYIKLTFTSISLDTYCSDNIDVFALEGNRFVLKKSLCREDYITEYYADNVILLLFRTNGDLTEGGFVAHYETRFPIPAVACGGIIDLSRDLGEIHYTEDKEPAVAGEQCVWTIRSSRSEEIIFQITDIQFEDCKYTFGLYATGFSSYSGDMDESLPVIKENIGNCEDPSSSPAVSIAGPLAFLVFPRFVGSFKLTLRSSTTDTSLIQYPYNSNYTDFIFTEPQGSLLYPGPENWPQFDAYLWISFVINPINKSDSGRTVLQFTQLDLGQANSCWSANVMAYEIRNGLLEQYMICNDGQVGTVDIFADNTIVLLLRTSSVWSSYANTIRAEWEHA